MMAAAGFSEVIDLLPLEVCNKWQSALSRFATVMHADKKLKNWNDGVFCQPTLSALAVPGQAYMGVVPGKQYTEAPPGVSEHAKLNNIEPHTCFQHDLLPGESILKTYDVHMPNILIARWQLYLWSCLTLGIFYIFWMCYMWCLRKGFCTLPSITMQRGMMAVTSTGCILVWKTNLNQVRMGKYPMCFKCCCGDKCRDPIDWTSTTLSRTYKISNINEISLRLAQTQGFLCGICCCTELYESSVRVRIREFGVETARWGTVPFQTLTTEIYKQIVATFFTSAGIDLYALALSVINAFAPKPLDVDWVDIVSERQDETTKDLENPDFKDSYTGLSDIARTITQLITEKRSAVWKKPSNDSNLMMPHQAQVDDVNSFATMDLVKDDSCAAPPAYVPLAPAERVIATSADVYMITCMDIFKMIMYMIACMVLLICIGITAGLSAIFVWIPLMKLVDKILDLSEKRLSRNGYILTTHRIVHMKIWRKDTFLSICCPSALLCCFPTQQEISVRSLFPKKIESGIIRRDNRDLTAWILTNAGAFSLHFDLSSSISEADYMRAEALISKRLAFIKAMCSVAARTRVLDASTVNVAADFQVYAVCVGHVRYAGAFVCVGHTWYVGACWRRDPSSLLVRMPVGQFGECGLAQSRQ